MHKCSEIQNVETELKYVDLFKCYWIFEWFRGSPSLEGWGWVDWGGTLSGCLGDTPRMCAGAHTCMHVCACAYMYKHDNFMQMAAPIGKFWGICYHIITHVCTLMHACACPCVYAWATLQTPWQSHAHPLTPTPPKRGTSGISQNWKALELIEIFQFCLKIWNVWRIADLWVGV